MRLATSQLKHRLRSYTTDIIERIAVSRNDNALGIIILSTATAFNNTRSILAWCFNSTLKTFYMHMHSE